MNRPLVISLIVALLLCGAGGFAGRHFEKTKEREKKLEAIARVSHERGEEMGDELRMLESLVRKETPEEWRFLSAGGGSAILDTSFKYDHDCMIVASKDASKGEVDAFAARLAELPAMAEWKAQATPLEQVRKVEFLVEPDGFYKSFTLKVVFTVRFEPKID